jgi:hypothetical protein
MIPRSGPRLAVLSPGRIFSFGDPHRRQECFLTEVSSGGLQVRTNFAMPIDEVMGMELETHLVLVDVRSCQLRHGKFWMGLERLHALPVTALDGALTVEDLDGASAREAKHVARLLAMLESFLQQPASNPSRRIMSQTRAAYGKLLTLSTQPSCEKASDVVVESTPAPTVEDQTEARLPMAGAPPVLLAPITIIAEALPALQNTVEEVIELQPVVEFEAAVDELQPAAEIIDATPKPLQRKPVGRAPFFYSVPVDLTVAHHAPHAAPPADWIYHFVPSPKAPIVPDLNYAAKGLIEALHATA